MIHRVNQFQWRILFCMLLVFLTACGALNQSAETSLDFMEEDGPGAVSGDTIKTYPIPQENRPSASVYGYSPSTTSDGYYAVSTKVRYYDAETESCVILCAQPGCAHADETCQAWVGPVISYVEYHKELLATVQNGEGSVQLIRKDLTTGAVTVLESWQGSDTDLYNVVIGRAADNRVTIHIYRTHMFQEEEVFRSERYESTWLYDLTAGSMQELFPEDETGSASVLALSKEYALVTYIPAESLREMEQMDEETLHTRYGDDISFGRYFMKIMPRELRLYDLETGSFTVIASTKKDHYAVSSDACHIYGEQVLYQCKDTLYIFDMDKVESTAFITMEGIINYSLRDHKVFFIVRDGDGGETAEDTLHFYWADLDDGIPVRLENDGNTEVAVFNPLYECGSFFVGYYKGAHYIIDKADYYTDCYENAILAR